MRRPEDAQDGQQSSSKSPSRWKSLVRQPLQRLVHLSRSSKKCGTPGQGEAAEPPNSNFEPQPISGRIPFEVMGHIFCTLILDEHRNSRTRLNNAERAVLVDLCLVCKSWRGAALATPSLWNGVNVQLEEGRRASVSKMAVWLSRSGSLPKHLEIAAPLCKGQDSSYHPCELKRNPQLRTFMDVVPFLHSLTISCGGPRCIDGLFNSTSSPLKSTLPPNLFLDFSGSQHWLALLEPEVPTYFFRDLPLVRHFSLALPHWKDIFPNLWLMDVHKLNLPPALLGGLTSLHFSANWTVSPFAEVLRQCINLEELTLDFAGSRLGDDMEEVLYIQLVKSPIPLAKLRKVRLTRCTPAATKILTMLRLSSLIELDVEMEWTYPNDVLEGWIPAIKSHSRIQSLCIRASSIVPAALQSLFLHDLPSVGDLTLEIGGVKPLKLLLEFLNHPPSMPHNAFKGRWLPGLENLGLLSVHPDFHFGSVVDFVRERLPVKAITETGTGSLSSLGGLKGVATIYSCRRPGGLPPKEYERLYSAEIRQLSEWGVSASVRSDRGPAGSSPGNDSPLRPPAFR